MLRNFDRDKQIGEKKKKIIFPFPSACVCHFTYQKSNFDTRRSGKPDGNALSPVDILRNMTLLGNVQSLLSVA